MRIILVIKAIGPSSYIYASADAGEKPYLSYASLRFTHNAASRGLAFGEKSEVYDNDQYLVFESKVPFQVFCQRMMASEFNDPDNYHLLTHNCAHGAAYALNAAGINIEFPGWVAFNRVGDRADQVLPIGSFTPLDLYYLAKEHKLNLLSAKKIEFKYELAKHSLLFRARQSSDENTIPRIADIIAADEKLKDAHPEHAEMHLQVLLTTMTLLLTPSAADYKEYRELVRYSRERASLAWPGLPLAVVSNSLKLQGLAVIIKYIVQQAGYLADLPSIDTTPQNMAISLAVGVGIGLGLYELLLRPAFVHRDITDSALTKAMQTFQPDAPEEAKTTPNSPRL